MELIDKCSLGGQDSDGSVGSTDKSRMLDITRDKPIKVAVRVVVPVRDHPKFNFVGKLLGPKGNSMKRLQEDTMCKMAVLGRGSVKDRKKEEELRLSGDPRYTHLFEDLHVEISTFAPPAEAHARIAYALAEVRRFLVPDYHDDIRQEQMWEMQALSSSQQNASEAASLLDSLSSVAGDENGIADGGESAASSGPDCSVVATSGTGLLCTGNSILNGAAVTAANSCESPLSGGLHLVHNFELNGPLDHQQQQQRALNSRANQMLTAGGAGGVLCANRSALQSDVDGTMYLDAGNGLVHPALRGLKAVNIGGGNLNRKRPLLGGPRSCMNPTKRTVMTLLARAKNAQTLHGLRNRNGGISVGNIEQPMHQMIASPLILQ